MEFCLFNPHTERLIWLQSLLTRVVLPSSKIGMAMPNTPRISPGPGAGADSLDSFRRLDEAEARAQIGSLLTSLRGLESERTGRVELILTKDTGGRERISAAFGRASRNEDAKLGLHALRILLDRVKASLPSSADQSSIPLDRNDLDSLLQRYVSRNSTATSGSAPSTRLQGGRVNPLAMMAVGHTKAPWLAASVRRADLAMQSANPEDREAAKSQFALDLARIPASGETLDDFTVACLVMRALDALSPAVSPDGPSREERLISLLPAAVALRWLTAVDAGQFPASDEAVRTSLVGRINAFLESAQAGGERDASLQALLDTLRSIPEERQSQYSTLLVRAQAIANGKAAGQGITAGAVASNQHDDVSLQAALVVLASEHDPGLEPLPPQTIVARGSAVAGDSIAELLDGAGRNEMVQAAGVADDEGIPSATIGKSRVASSPASNTSEISARTRLGNVQELSKASELQESREASIVGAALGVARQIAIKRLKVPNPSTAEIARHLSSQLDESEAQSLAVALAARPARVIQRLPKQAQNLHEVLGENLLKRPASANTTQAMASFRKSLAWDPGFPSQQPIGDTPRKRLLGFFDWVRLRGSETTPAVPPVSMNAFQAQRLRETSWEHSRQALIPAGLVAQSARPIAGGEGPRESHLPISAGRPGSSSSPAHVVVAQLRVSAQDQRGLASFVSAKARSSVPAGWYADLAQGVERLPAIANRRDIQTIREAFVAQVTADAKALEQASQWFATEDSSRKSRRPDPAQLAEVFARQLSYLSRLVKSRPLQGWLGLPGDQINTVLLGMIATLIRVNQRAGSANWIEDSPVPGREGRITAKRAAGSVSGIEAARREARRSPEVDLLLGTLGDCDPEVEALRRAAVETLVSDDTGLAQVGEQPRG